MNLPTASRRLATLLLVCSFAVGAHSAPGTSKNPVAVIKTDLGDITVELYAEAAPETVANFTAYANSYFYELLIFHRIVDGFMIQTGGYRFDLSPKEPKREPIANESGNGLKNLRGTLAMARHRDPDSARAQFYINLQDNNHLDATAERPGYTVFGKVITGMEVVDKIAKVPVHKVNASLTHVPKQPVQIQTISVKQTVEENKQ